MGTASFHLPINSDTARRTATRWLMLGLVSLVAAGLFSILLVLARTPNVQELIPFVDFFHVALVVHVNLSVLIWLLSIAGTLILALDIWILLEGFHVLRDAASEGSPAA